MANDSNAPQEISESRCGICLEEFEDQTTVQSCGHEFCYECISRWIAQRNRCPICRGRIRSLRHMVEQAVPIPPHSQPHVRYFGSYAVVQTPLDTHIYCIEPVQVPGTMMHCYSEIRLNQDFAYQLQLHPKAVFVLPEDLTTVEASLEQAGIRRIDRNVHYRSSSRHWHGAFLGLHKAHPPPKTGLTQPDIIPSQPNLSLT